jgi:hypothetical protein
MGLHKAFKIIKSGVNLNLQISSIRRALKAELMLNKKSLSDIKKNKSIDDNRRRTIIGMLQITALSDAVNNKIPFLLICRRTVISELAVEFKAKRTTNYNFEKMVMKLYIMIKYLQNDIDNKNLDLKKRLIFIYKYNCILLRLLS